MVTGSLPSGTTIFLFFIYLIFHIVVRVGEDDDRVREVNPTRVGPTLSDNDLCIFIGSLCTLFSMEAQFLFIMQIYELYYLVGKHQCCTEFWLYHIADKEILGLVHLYPQRKVLAFGSTPQTLKPKMDMKLRFTCLYIVW